MAFAGEPVHFSHKKHAPLKIQCRYCHTTVETGEKASFPAVAKCMNCHRAVKKDSPQIQRLQALGDDAAPFPTMQVYVAKDYVIFSHARHRKVECRMCHGAVMERDAITTPEVPVTMKGCLDCHKARRVSSDCHTCHELGQ
jgi:hypothetical protein